MTNLHPTLERILRYYPSPALRYFIEHWKIGVHIVLHTKYFGVNNRWWSNLGMPSIIGWPTWEIVLGVVTVKPMIVNMKAALIRAFALGFMAPEERIHLIPVVRLLGKFMDLKFLDIHIKRTKEFASRED